MLVIGRSIKAFQALTPAAISPHSKALAPVMRETNEIPKLVVHGKQPN